MCIVDNRHISYSAALLTSKEWHVTYYAANRTRQDMCLAVNCVVGFLASISMVILVWPAAVSLQPSSSGPGSL